MKAGGWVPVRVYCLLNFPLPTEYQPISFLLIKRGTALSKHDLNEFVGFRLAKLGSHIKNTVTSRLLQSFHPSQFLRAR